MPVAVSLDRIYERGHSRDVARHVLAAGEALVGLVADGQLRQLGIRVGVERVLLAVALEVWVV